MPWINQDDHRIFYQRLGAAPGPGVAGVPVILHHGLAQWSEDWVAAGWLAAFGDRDVFALDALGHGRSDRPVDRYAYSIERRADAVIRIADAEGLERFVLFGFSMGGRAAFHAVCAYPGRIRGLIVGGMHGLKPSIDRKNLERRIAVLRSKRWTLVERAVGARATDGRGNDAESLALSTEAVLDWPGAEACLPGLNVPVLLFCGVMDSILEYAEQTAALLPNCRLERLPGYHHASSFRSYASTPEGKSMILSYLEGVDRHSQPT